MRGTGGGTLSALREADKSERRRTGEQSRESKSSRITSIIYRIEISFEFYDKS